MILFRTSSLMLRLLLQPVFLRCIKFRLYKSMLESINQIVKTIPGLGYDATGIYESTYLAYTLFTHLLEKSCKTLIPLFTAYAKFRLNFKEGIPTPAPDKRIFLRVQQDAQTSA